MNAKRRAKQLALPGRQFRFACKLDALAADMAKADATTGTPDLTPKWVQVAAAGDYKGYAGGAFVFDDKTFAQIIQNFRQHPSYKAGADGVGAEDVIPWDFNHASAAFAADGTIPITGTPAQGWVRELKTQTGVDGLELWALTNWLEPARTYITEGRYKWASVVVGFDCRDQKTNANIGAVLESIALTNNPFIEGMQKLAADRHGGPRAQGKPMQQVTLDYWYGKIANGPEDAFECLRGLFGLSQTADVGAVLAELMKLQTWSTSGGAPIGVDLDELVGSVRTIFNLPALSSTEEVFAESSKLLGALLQQQALEEMEPEIPPVAAPPATETTPPAPAAAMEKKNMSLIKLVASRLGVLETEAAATAAFESLLTLRASLAKKFGLTDVAGDTVLLDAASGAADARTKLGALLAALGIEDSSAAVEKIAGLMTQATQLEAAMPELKALREAAAATDAKQGDEEVDKVMNSMGSDNAGVRVALVTLRKTDKAGFDKQFADVLASKPAPAAGGAGNLAYLTTNLTGAPGAAERTIVQNKDGSVALSAPGAGSKTGAPSGGKPRVDLSKQQGRNRTERAMDYVRATVAGAKDWGHDALFDAAVKLIHESEIVDAA